MKKFLVALFLLLPTLAIAADPRNPCYPNSVTSTNCIPVTPSTPLPTTSTITGSTSNAGSGVASSATNTPVVSYNYWWNGASWDQSRSIAGANTNGIGTSAVAIAPSSVGGITPVTSTTASSNLVLKASAGNLYSLAVTAGASAGFVMLFNSTTAPADGTVTPIECVPVAANNAVAINFGSGPPEAYSVGITAVFSTTGCFTKTASSTAFFSGKVQ